MRKLLLFVVLLSLSLASNAERVRSAAARKVAKTMLPSVELVDISSESNFNNLYIFSSDNGFVIVSADDRAFPVIAYSDENPFVVKDMSVNVYSWLKSVNEGIQEIADSKVVASEAVKAEWKSFSNGKKPAAKYRSAVEPLIKTKWNQVYPDNNLCPMIGEERTVTGCVATAMAQIMNYWEWPHRGVGEKSYTRPRPVGKLTANFGETLYDWDNMYDSDNVEWTEEEVKAVSTLMFHCGVSVSMQYGTAESGGSAAYSSDVAPALTEYFDYDPNLQYIYRPNSGYTDEEWENLLKTELNAGRPIYYAGNNNDGLSGHAFVCDGYDANGYFHFNWGWSGHCDGYYLTGNLEPGTGGTGAGSSGNYSYNNEIIIGIQPNPSTSRISAPTNLAAEVDFPNATITWSEVAEAVSYKLYRDGRLIAKVTECSYTDLDLGRNTYYVRSVSEDGMTSVKSETLDVEVLYPGPEITELVAERYNVNNVKLSWTTDVVEKATLKYYDGDFTGYNTVISSGDYWGHRFTKDELMNYIGMSVTSVDVVLYGEKQYELAVFTEEYGALEKVYSQEFICPSSYDKKWFAVTLDTPLLLDYTKNVLIMCRFVNGDGYGYAPVATKEEHGDYGDNAEVYILDGSIYYGGDDSFLIKTNLLNSNTYDVYRDGEKIASEINENTYNDADLDLGTYEYSVRTNYSGGVTEPKTVTIELGEPEEFNVTISTESEEKGSVEGGGKYLESTLVTVKATPKLGYEFKEWTENGTQVSTEASYTFNITDNRELVAHFVENNLSIEVVGTTRPTYLGGADGKIEVKAKSGTAPYIYELGNDVSSPVNASYTFENLVAGSYTVKATDATGFSVTATVVLDGSGELSPPTNVKAVADGTTITLSWDPVVGAECYGIYLNYGVNMIGWAFEPKFELENLSPETTYCYFVVSFAEIDDEGFPTKYSDFSEEACATTGSGSGEDDETEVLPPTNVKAVADGNIITLSWNPVDGALAYGVFCDGEFLDATYSTYVQIEGFKNGVTYCFTVVSITEVDADGYITDYSDESEEACATTEGEAVEVLPPTNVKAVAKGNTIILSWNPVDGALAYGVFCNGEFLDGTYDTSVQIDGLKNGVTYCFTVVSITEVDAEGYITDYSDESEEACATIGGGEAVEELTTSFNIYPNPVDDKLYIETEMEVESVLVYDMYGRQLSAVSYQPSVVDVSELNGGVYFVKIITSQGEITKRFVKK